MQHPVTHHTMRTVPCLPIPNHRYLGVERPPKSLVQNFAPNTPRTQNFSEFGLGNLSTRMVFLEAAWVGKKKGGEGTETRGQNSPLVHSSCSAFVETSFLLQCLYMLIITTTTKYRCVTHYQTFGKTQHFFLRGAALNSCASVFLFAPYKT